MSIRFSRRAIEDIDRILGYLADRSPSGHQSIGRAIFRAVDLIAEFPNRGRLSGQERTRVLQTGHYPYLLYWEVDRADVWIVHVRHAARRPWQGGED